MRQDQSFGVAGWSVPGLAAPINHCSGNTRGPTRGRERERDIYIYIEIEREGARKTPALGRKTPALGSHSKEDPCFLVRGLVRGKVTLGRVFARCRVFSVYMIWKGLPRWWAFGGQKMFFLLWGAVPGQASRGRSFTGQLDFTIGISHRRLFFGGTGGGG